MSAEPKYTEREMAKHLRKFCTGPDDYRPHLADPFNVEHDGSRWDVATNGHRLLMVQGSEFPARADAPVNVESVVAPFKDARAFTVDLAALAAFVGVPTEPRTCDKCDNGEIECAACEGEGGEECECGCGHIHDKDCDECSGRGVIPCEACKGWRDTEKRIQPVFIGNTPFSRRMLAGALYDAELTAGEGTWLVLDGVRPCALRGDGWLLALMQIRLDEDPATVPVFPLTPEPEVARA